MWVGVPDPAVHVLQDLFPVLRVLSSPLEVDSVQIREASQVQLRRVRPHPLHPELQTRSSAETLWV